MTSTPPLTLRLVAESLGTGLLVTVVDAAVRQPVGSGHHGVEGAPPTGGRTADSRISTVRPRNVAAKFSCTARTMSCDPRLLRSSPVLLSQKLARARKRHWYSTAARAFTGEP